MTTSRIAHIYQEACKGTASGRGPSYWSVATTCGRRRALLDAGRLAVEDGEATEAVRTGTFTHALLHGLTAGLTADDLRAELTSGVTDTDWADALRIALFYAENYPGDYFGRVIGSEIKLPVSPQHEAAIEKFFGHTEVTGQVDRIVEIDAYQCARLEREFGAMLRGPGVYILDFKTSGARWSDARAQSAAEGMQSMTYQVLWNLAGGVAIQGALFVVLVKHKTLTPEKSVQLFGSFYQPDWPEIVKAGVNLARQRRDEALADPYACYTLFDACPFLNKGCSRK